MKKATKAVLLSALVLPGAGHFLLKKYGRGSVLAVVALIALYRVCSAAVEGAQAVLTDVQSGALPLDAMALSDAIAKQNTVMTQWASVVLGVAWVMGIVDAYRQGKKKDSTAD